MNILIIGLGSIAKKHIAAIKEIDEHAKIYALRSKKTSNRGKDVINVFSYDQIDDKLDFCIISNPTFKHYETINHAIDLKVPLFIEKPSLMNLDNAEILLNKLNKNKILTYVAFNLRFHPVIHFLKSYLINKRIIEVNIYCGSYLPDWRPDVDYTKNYSAIAEMGGGVHLDLIHEIDYSIFLFGKPEETFSIKRKISNLKINSKDVAVYNLLYKDKIINIVLNYYRRKPKREIEIVTDNSIITADLLENTIKDDINNVLYSGKIDNMLTYKKQMNYFYDLLYNKVCNSSFNSFQDSLETLKICLA